jgi:hypothetical protein
MARRNSKQENPLIQFLSGLAVGRFASRHITPSIPLGKTRSTCSPIQVNANFGENWLERGHMSRQPRPYVPRPKRIAGNHFSAEPHSELLDPPTPAENGGIEQVEPVDRRMR